VKVIFLSTGRGLSPAFIHELRAKLGMHDSDVACLISWHPARKPLPVSRHLVLGPNIRVAGALATVQRVQRQPYPITADVTAVDVTAEDVSADAEDLAPEIATPPPDLTNPADPDASEPTEPAAAPAVAEPTDPAAAYVPAHEAATMLPVYDPRRMRKAVAWRIRRAKKAAATHASPRLTGIRTHPLFRKVRNRLSPGVSLSFAASCLRSGQVHDMARDADLVVALDAASHRGAWTLAQKVAGPDVVIGIPAAKRILEEHQTSATS